ncbi:MAG: cystathionine beta-lyase [Alphaproteobacteria bacterium]|nr:cystathionine beta-lyase [Alphaproteobacteria bacterium]MBL6953764.1 cystathionine beta-lyase [Alphaproteobacteria bacterium]
MKDETKLVIAGRDPENNHGIVNPPVYHASTVLHPTLAHLDQSRKNREKGERGVYYGRIGTPTNFSLEDMVCAIEGGDHCLIYPSGLAAIAAAMLSFLKAGDHILMVDTVYGPSRRFCNSLASRFNVSTTYYDPAIGAGIAALIQDNTRIVYVEAPGSQTFVMQDIPAIADAAHARGCTVMMDNTWASPLYCKPFTLGVDVSIQAGTKYIVGHSDVMIGTACANKKAWPELEATSRMLGQTAGPDDIYLAQRGMRTLSVRLKQHWESGLKVAEWLAGQDMVECVMHPALPDDPGHALWKRDFLGASGLFGITLKPCPRSAIAAMVDDLELFGMGASWGGFESLILPTDPNSMRSVTPWPYEGQCMRLHIGLEDPDDLIADLTAGFKRLQSAM